MTGDETPPRFAMFDASGGDPADFDTLIPIDGPYGREPDAVLLASID